MDNFWVMGKVPGEKAKENTVGFKRGYEFLKKETHKYLLRLESKLNIAGIATESVVEIRWIFSVKDIYPEGYECELITLDNTMIHDGNGGMAAIHKLVVQMQKALNEIYFRSDKKGNLLNIKNLNTIKEKWQSVKAEMMEYNKKMTSLQEVFSIQEKNLDENGGVEKMVGSLEFFTIYFNSLYGRKYPFGEKKMIPNIFRTCEIPFRVSYIDEKADGVFRTASFHNLTDHYSEQFLRKAYGQFPFIKIEELEPKFTYKGSYKINETSGFLESGQLILEEMVAEKLNACIIYKLKRYE